LTDAPGFATLADDFLRSVKTDGVRIRSGSEQKDTHDLRPTVAVQEECGAETDDGGPRLEPCPAR
jgi:hypothetical protein